MDIFHKYVLPQQHGHSESRCREHAKRNEATIALQANMQSILAQHGYTCPHCGHNLFGPSQLRTADRALDSRSAFLAFTDDYKSLQEDLSKTSPGMQKYVQSLEEAYKKQLCASTTDGVSGGSGSNTAVQVHSENTAAKTFQPNIDGLTDPSPMTKAPTSAPRAKWGQKGFFTTILRRTR